MPPKTCHWTIGVLDSVEAIYRQRESELLGFINNLTRKVHELESEKGPAKTAWQARLKKLKKLNPTLPPPKATGTEIWDRDIAEKNELIKVHKADLHSLERYFEIIADVRNRLMRKNKRESIATAFERMLPTDEHREHAFRECVDEIFIWELNTGKQIRDAKRRARELLSKIGELSCKLSTALDRYSALDFRIPKPGAFFLLSELCRETEAGPDSNAFGDYFGGMPSNLTTSQALNTLARLAQEMHKEFSLLLHPLHPINLSRKGGEHDVVLMLTMVLERAVRIAADCGTQPNQAGKQRLPQGYALPNNSEIANIAELLLGTTQNEDRVKQLRHRRKTARPK